MIQFKSIILNTDFEMWAGKISCALQITLDWIGLA